MSLPQNPMSANRTRTLAQYQDGPVGHLTRLFALIIGINDYRSKQFYRLRGAVPDGKEFKDYLMKGLRVPEGQIFTLFGEQATRSAIIQAFKDLSKDDRIKEGDPIFIFYAGHGAQKTPHPDWKEPNAKIEVIVPYDCTDDSDRQTPATGFVPSIPDITIAALINEIAREKGNNITVVFDCCHSASGTRSSSRDDSSTRVRSVLLGDLEFDSNTDRDIWDCHSRGTRPYAGYSRRGLNSHMLISACSSSEKAVEHEGRGRLSVALLKLFDKVSPHKLRYCDILENIDQIPGQNPQCQGDAQTRHVFGGKVELSGKVYSITYASRTSEYILDAGAALGIAIDAEFRVYHGTDKMLRRPLGTMIINKLMPFFAEMKPVQTISPPIPTLLARQTKLGNLSNFLFYIPPEDRFYSHYRKKCPSDLKLQNIFLVPKPEDAHLKIRTSLRTHLLVIEVTDARVTQHGMNVIADQMKPDPDNVSWILERAAHYHRELDRISDEHHITNSNSNVTVGFFKLDPPVILPFGWTPSKLMCIGPNLCQNNVIDFEVDEGKPYGVCIKNNTLEDLYVNAFFFDNTNFAITPYYITHLPKGPYKLESPLKHGDTLTLGYGSGGTEPFTYPITPGRAVDVGFLKIYLSTKAFDLSGIAQGTAFAQDRANAPWYHKPCETWDTILIPVIQRRSYLGSGMSGRHPRK